MTADLTTLRNPQTTRAVPAPRRRWLTRIALPGGILLLMAMLLAYAARDTLIPARPVTVVRAVAKPVDVTTTAEAAAEDAGPAPLGPVTVQAPGWLEPDPYPIYVSALTDGVVEQVRVLEGEAVAAGQVVARLVADDARIAHQQATAELARREAELLTARAALAAAQTDWDEPIERDRAVAVAQATVNQTRAQIGQLDATIAEQQARLGEVKQQYDRIARLLPNATSELEVEQARYRVEAQAALVKSTQEQRQVLEAQLAAQEAELTAARRNRELRVTERKMLDGARAEVAQAQAMVDEAKAALDDAKLRLERIEVKSPVDGVVMTRLSNPGDKVMLAGDMIHSAHIVHLYDPKKLQVRVDVPLADAAKIGLGQPATVVVDVLPDRQFRGSLSRIVHKASIEKNTLEVKVAVHDPAPELKPDMLTRVKFHAVVKAPEGGGDGGAVTTRQQLRVFVPEKLLIKHGESHVMAWVIDPTDATARQRTVTLGAHRQDGWVEIATGLNPGDVIIAETQGLEEGERVKIEEAGK